MPSTVLRQQIGPNRGWCCANIMWFLNVGLGTTPKIFQVYIWLCTFLFCIVKSTASGSLVCASNLDYLPVAAYE